MRQSNTPASQVSSSGRLEEKKPGLQSGTGNGKESAAVRGFVLIALLLLLLSSCSGVLKGGTYSTYFGEGLDYKTEMRGVEEKNLYKRLKAASEAFSPEEGMPPFTLLHLTTMAERDVSMFVKVLRAEGYYAARADYTIDDKLDPVLLRYIIETGPLYRLKEIRLTPHASFDQAANLLPRPDELPLRSGDAVKSSQVISAERTVVALLRKQGFPFAALRERTATINHSDRTASIVFTVETGRKALLGETTFQGLITVDEDFLRGIIPWQRGDVFDEQLIQKFQRRLFETGLFSIVRIHEAQEVDNDDMLAVKVEATERKHRSVSAGVSYRTDEKLGAKSSWEHRNIAGKAERLSIGMKASNYGAAAEGSFVKPQFFHRLQKLKLVTSLAEDRPEAYISRYLSSLALVEREIYPRVIAAAGLGIKVSSIEQQSDREDYQLLSAPFTLSRETSDDIFDPTRGGKLILQMTPMHDVRTEGRTFLKSTATYTHYLALMKSPILVLAARVSVGSVIGQSRLSIPADERFYAGGGGSIRGYAYQSVAPMSADGTPTGGRSIAEFSLELRGKITEKIGLAVFADGGGAFSSSDPLEGERLRWAAGLGLRYFTQIGPLRADVGFPLNPRPDMDDSFQFYVSLGQAY